jgi:DNA-binding NtrC family response regulator
MSVLEAHAWPGNVRELAHSVERAVLMAEAGTVTLGAAELTLGSGAPRSTPPRSGPDRALQDLPLEEIERIFIQKALTRYGGDVRRAADHLGLSRSALYRRLQQISGAPVSTSDDDDRG